VEQVAVLHSTAEDQARAFLKDIQTMFPGQKILLGVINPVLGAHIGPGVLGIACISQASGG
jgi:fatty acid-binding protein DegV